RGASERASRMACWGFCKARARARRGRRPQPWPGHGDGEVATVRRLWAAWRRRGHQREAKGGGGGAARRVGASAKQDVGGNRAEELEEGEKDPNVISEISRD